MNDYEAGCYTDAECEAEFAHLFPQGFAGQNVLGEIAPEGWEQSPLVATFHPSLEQVYEEAVQLHRNLQAFPWRKDRPPEPEPTREEVAQRYQEEPIDTEREVRELVGKCLWDIFSDNHDVIGPDGRVVDIGSFRGAGGFIADCINRQTGSREYDYIDFYLGTIWIAQRTDLTPVYRMIFRRLKARGYDWTYAFPKLGLVDLRPLRDTLHEPTESAGDNVSPASTSASEEDEERDRALAELRESLETSHRKAVEDAHKGPPPETVQAYQSVYGRFPEGWPPVA
ncbi:MAG: hypothetical protein HYY20_05220 [Candidatus Tectomicrobia bacterium]|uniref:Uncharacterized protein n=1 Tax=Tectimicrobiota bacterium TaxID=2528274 RepID=A0A932CMY6_UNCTE|nr:hypothetical protein [Candidatus Tectomicrobia bacterium]